MLNHTEGAFYCFLSLRLSASLFLSLHPSLFFSLILSQGISISVSFSVSLWSLSLFFGVSSSLFLFFSLCVGLSPSVSLPRSLTHAHTSPQVPFTCPFLLLHLHGQDAILTVGWAPAQKRNFLSPQCRALVPGRAHSAESMYLGSSPLKAEPEMVFLGSVLIRGSSQERPQRRCFSELAPPWEVSNSPGGWSHSLPTK